MLNKLKYYAHNIPFKGKSRQYVFTHIYEQQKWGSPDNQNFFYSGNGSHNPDVINPYIYTITKWLGRAFKKKPDVLDIGCGDFHVGKHIRPSCNKYTAVDIVPELIEANKKRYANLKVDFRVKDAVCDDLPAAKIVFLRQVLQHLSNKEIHQILLKLRGNYDYWVVTEHLPLLPFVANKEHCTGAYTRLRLGSGVLLHKPPFNVDFADKRLVCAVPAYGGSIDTFIYGGVRQVG